MPKPKDVIVCEICGAINPLFFMVPDAEWEFYIEPEYRAAVICPDCFIAIREKVNASHPGPTPLNTNIRETVIDFYIKALAYLDNDFETYLHKDPNREEAKQKAVSLLNLLAASRAKG